jgi:superfamily I DNA and RNA helicase
VLGTTVFLDPAQSAVIGDPNPIQVILGHAASGKSFLIQLKAVELLKQDSQSKVMVIVPLEEMKEKYALTIHQCTEDVENLAQR